MSVSMRTAQRICSALVASAVLVACSTRDDSRADSAQRVVDSAAPAGVAPGADESSAPWDAARARGVDFRAIGQEPGWTLDIHDGELLRYIGDYGRDSISSAITTPSRQGNGVVEYAVSAQARALHVVILEAACQDAMSGAVFTHTVTIHIDKQELRGCGRRL